MNTTLIQRLGAGSAAAAAVIGGALAISSPGATAASGTKLSGLLKLSPGKVSLKGGRVAASGTYFRMLTPTAGQYFSNPNASSNPKLQSYTPLKPGTAGGLKLGAYQPAPSPAFDKNGNSLAKSIVEPTKFAEFKFSIDTNRSDTQTHSADPAPSLTLNGTKLTGNLSAWDAQWHDQSFNQGSPKPTGGAYAGGTRPVTGTYNARTHAFTITWYSHIVGGPFNGFTGYWHLQGKLVK